MCGVCGGGGGPRDGYAADIEDSPAARKRAQLGLAAWATRLFGPERVRVHDLPGTVRVMVTGPTGQCFVAQGVDEVLDAVDRIMAGRTPWPAIADRLLTAAGDGHDHTDWAYRSLTHAVARRRNPLT